MKRQLAWLVAGIWMLLAALPATAGPGPSGIDRVAAVDTGRAKFIVASAQAGLVLINDRLEVVRIYRYQPLTRKGGSGERLRMVVLDPDGGPQIIGIGKPSFGLDATGNPLWDFPEGCSELATGDLLATPEKELVCIHGRAITNLAADGSLNWNVQLSNANMTALATGMLGTTEGKEGIEFNVGREILRFKGDGSPIPGEFTERMTTPEDLWKAAGEELADLLSGKTPFDLNGDGTAEETMTVQGAKLLLKPKPSDAPVEYTLPTGAIHSAALASGWGEDGRPLLVIGGEKMVALLGGDGRLIKELAIDFARAFRVPKVELVGVNAVGFEARDSATQLVQAEQAALSSCYEKRHRAYSLTRQGKTMFKFDIGDQGRVKGHETVYTTLNDAEVAACLTRAVSRLTFPRPTEPGAHITVDLLFTWSDSFK